MKVCKYVEFEANFCRQKKTIISNTKTVYAISGRADRDLLAVSSS